MILFVLLVGGLFVPGNATDSELDNEGLPKNECTSPTCTGCLTHPTALKEEYCTVIPSSPKRFKSNKGKKLSTLTTLIADDAEGICPKGLGCPASREVISLKKQSDDIGSDASVSKIIAPEVVVDKIKPDISTVDSVEVRSEVLVAPAASEITAQSSAKLDPQYKSMEEGADTEVAVPSAFRTDEVVLQGESTSPEDVIALKKTRKDDIELEAYEPKSGPEPSPMDAQEDTTDDEYSTDVEKFAVDAFGNNEDPAMQGEVVQFMRIVSSVDGEEKNKYAQLLKVKKSYKSAEEDKASDSESDLEIVEEEDEDADEAEAEACDAANSQTLMSILKNKRLKKITRRSYGQKLQKTSTRSEILKFVQISHTG